MEVVTADTSQHVLLDALPYLDTEYDDPAVQAMVRTMIEEEMAEMRVAEEDHGAQVNAVRVQNRLDIEAQIQYRDSMAAKKKEEQRRQWESSMRAEADYQRMIENDQRRANPATPSYARKSTAWFD